MHLIVWQILVICASFAYGHNCKLEPKCKIVHVKGMKAADCYQKNFRQFPQCISNDVEVIDLSLNRIRKITNEDLKRYSYLKVLYLSDNILQVINNDIFEFNNELTAVDLSINALSELPEVIFQLPSLKTLYLGQNWNMNIVDAIEKAKPITSPLVHLDISYIMVDDPTELPNLDIMPFLAKYNISGNKISTLSTRHFAGLCSLKILDTTNTSVDFDKLCDCWTINRWLKKREVHFNPFECRISESECYDPVDKKDIDTFNICEEQVDKIIKQSQLLKILVPIAVVLLITFISAVYFGMKKRKQRQRQINNQQQQLPKNEGNTLLISNFNNLK